VHGPGRLVAVGWTLVLALSAGPSSTAAPDAIVPLARAHAHNDYLHPRPLLDALDAGFTSIETDVWLVDGDLLVAHDRREVRAYEPMLTDNWMRHFVRTGVGPMPEDERRKLREIVAAAHARRQRVRFWATPDSGPGVEAVWRELLRAGVDYINTDRLAALREFLRRADPSPSQPMFR